MPVDEFTPTTADVGALMRARTKDINGDEIGDFNDDTRPTGAEVDKLITDAVSDVASRTGANICDKSDLRANAQSMVVLRTAMKIELSYFPEQVPGNRSPFANYKSMYDDGMKELVDSIAELCEDETGDSPAGDAQLPYYWYGEEEIIGRRTIL